MKFFTVVFLVGIITHTGALCSACETLVTAKSGKYLGTDSKDGNVVKFLGIPYAKPPVGKLRFKPSSVIAPHTGIFEATSHGALCPQLSADYGEKYKHLSLNYTQSEDCLILDIYAPKAAVKEKQKAVLVWIHAGAYMHGSANIYDGSILVGLNDIIVISINYRLGILGFLSTLDEHAPGNYGILDQITALKWVNENIEAFGGDKSRITIGGVSAGGGSVTQLTLTPASQGLFHRAIAQSGSPFDPWTEATHADKHAKVVAANLGCPDNDSKALVECLREVPAEELLLHQRTEIGLDESKWTPVYNNEVFPFTKQDLLKNWKNISVVNQLAEIDLLTGVCSEEGPVFYNILSAVLKQQNNQTVGGHVTLPISLLPGMLPLVYKSVLPNAAYMPEVVLPIVKYEYTDWTNPNDEVTQARMFIKFFRDTMFVVGANQFVNIHSELVKIRNAAGSSSPVRNTFFYRFNQPGSWMESNPWRIGADHGDDLFFLFGFTFSDWCNSTLEEKVFTRKMMKYWSNFVKTGDPNEPVISDLPTWPAYDSDNKTFLELDTTLSANSVKTRMFPESMEFWTDFLPNQIKIVSEIKSQCSEGKTP